MKPYQKINHFPGMYALSRKNHLAINLNRMRKLFPREYSFFPKTWLIPADYAELKHSGKKPGSKFYIVKPEASSQGKGIFLTAKINDFELSERYVIQEYVDRPFLIDGLKFDLRIYVLVAGSAPLRVYLHREGLARFATESYIRPTVANISRKYVHLTNYAINKHNSKFTASHDLRENSGHKRSISAVMSYLEQEGCDTATLWKNIEDLIIKTLCSVQPSLAHTYKACQPDDPYNGMCFEVLGFDVILSSSLKPFLLEVNHSPSFAADSDLDKEIKTMVISDTLKLVNVSNKAKKEYENKRKADLARRTMSKRNEINRTGRESEGIAAQQKRDKWENNHLGGFLKIFPTADDTQYESILKGAEDIWEELTTGKARRPTPKTTTTERKPTMKALSIIQTMERRENAEKQPAIKATRGTELNKILEDTEQQPIMKTLGDHKTRKTMRDTPLLDAFERLSIPIQRETSSIIYTSKKVEISREKKLEGNVFGNETLVKSRKLFSSFQQERHD